MSVAYSACLVFFLFQDLSCHFPLFPCYLESLIRTTISLIAESVS